MNILKITRTAVGISILATFCLVAVLIVHAYSEFAYSSIYEKLETSDDPEVHDYIQTFLWAKSGCECFVRKLVIVAMI